MYKGGYKKKDHNRYKTCPTAEASDIPSSPEMDITPELENTQTLSLKKRGVNCTTYYSETKPSWTRHKPQFDIEYQTSYKHFKRDNFEHLSSIGSCEHRDTHTPQRVHSRASSREITEENSNNKFTVTGFVRRNPNQHVRKRRRGFQSVSGARVMKNNSVYTVPAFLCSAKPKF